jgi:hypothetical protein
LFLAALAIGLILWLGAVSPTAIAAALLVVTLALIIPLLLARRTAAGNLWDQSMLNVGGPRRWYGNLWLWWAVLAAILVGIYVKFW